MGKPYDDPEKLAEAMYYGGEKHSQQQMANYLGCSKGTISLRVRRFEDELEEYGPEDFEHITPEEEDTEDEFPKEFDLPDEWPPDQDILDEYFANGVDAEVVLDEAQWGCPMCLPSFRDMMENEFGIAV